MELSETAAVIFSVMAGTVVLFQFALALGAPWGEYAMGGAFPGRFPPAMRVAAVFQAGLLAAMVCLMLSRAGLALPQWSGAPDWLAWAVVVFAAVSLLLNSPGRSRRGHHLPAGHRPAGRCRRLRDDDGKRHPVGGIGQHIEVLPVLKILQFPLD